MRAKPALVRCNQVDAESRVACALHHTLKNHEGPLWLMIPVDEETIKRIEAIAIILENEEIFIHDIIHNDL